MKNPQPSCPGLVDGVRESMRRLIAKIILGAFCAGCASSPENALDVESIDLHRFVTAEESVDIETYHPVPAETTGDAPGSYEYLLGAGDLVSLHVWRNEDLSGDYKLGPDGFVSLPLFGPVDLNGMTRREARERLTEIIGSIYNDPKVSLIVDEYNNNNVFVLGEVMSPGVFKLEGVPTLLHVLSMAGGATPTADKSECTVIRGDDCLFKIDLNDLLRKGHMALNITLQPNDTVYVPDNVTKSIYVLGEVHQPTMVPVGAGLDLLRAITQAGSMTEDAVRSQVKVIRRRGGQVQILTVDVARIYEEGLLAANIPLEVNDIVYVPEKGMAKFNYVLRQISPSFSTIFVVDSLRKLGINDG